MGKNQKPIYTKIAFYTFIIAAVIYLLNSILSVVNISSDILHTIEKIVTLILFAVAGVAGWYFCRTKTSIYKLVYFISILVIIVAFVLPII